MARITSFRHLKVAFFVSVAIVLALALVLLYLALPAKVRAQPAPDCVPVASAVLVMRDRVQDGAKVDHLGATRAHAYQGALTGNPAMFDDAILIEAADGTGLIIEVYEGWLCPTSRAYAVPPDQHKQATYTIPW